MIARPIGVICREARSDDADEGRRPVDEEIECCVPLRLRLDVVAADMGLDGMRSE